MATPTTTSKSSIFVNSVPTNYLWATLLLKNIGAPITQNNIQNVLRWQAAENPPASWYNRNNPLNASLGTNKGDGTGSYSDLTTAAKETATMIVQGYKGGAIGGGIYTALMNDAPTDAFSIQVVNSNWSSNHYGVAAAGSELAVPGRQASWFTSIPVPGIVAASNADVNEGTAPAGSGVATPGTVSANAAANAGVKGCESKKPVFKTGGVFGVGSLEISACNVKAWGGGLSIFFGGGLMLGGLFMLSSAFAKSYVGKQIAPVVGQVSGGAGKIANAVSYEGRNSRQVSRQNKKTAKSRSKNEYESNKEFLKGE